MRTAFRTHRAGLKFCHARGYSPRRIGTLRCGNDGRCVAVVVDADEIIGEGHKRLAANNLICSPRNRAMRVAYWSWNSLGDSRSSRAPHVLQWDPTGLRVGRMIPVR